ncbi:WD repeat-containing protein 19 [Rhizoclosmatium globosum]|uniref:WD repeat-containing protein 19 n=1 Tax=Rhizoclosmatium globosum TaxID=329046 RepID=A0A1Y2CS69_9FUNG|nr:WD repeat-containing protein 19 [Rhizoclosmatium globosum]|eukprot:ORY49888.1 WD repeat-containing protein 19 [Rhizoclosmatium globosum]
MNKIFTLSSALHGYSNPPTSTQLQFQVHFKWQKSLCNILATTGVNNVLNLIDRHGHRIDNIGLPGPCISLAWSFDGEWVVAVVDNSPMLYVWDANIRKALAPIDTNMKGLSLQAWNQTSDVLAVASTKGNLLLLNRKTSKKIPVLGKHSKAIVGLIWNKDDVLACASLDGTFTLSNIDGDTIFQMGLKGEPSKLQWSTMRSPTADSPPCPVLSIVLSNKTIFFHSMANPDAPIELAFQSKYGSIVTYEWFGEGFLMIGFSSGYFIVVSTNMNEIGQEVFQSHNFKDCLNDVRISPALEKAATAGDGCIKVHELGDLKDVYAILTLEEDRGGLLGMEWTDDGGFLSVGTKNGNVYTFLSKLPVIGASAGTVIAYVTALREITIVDQNKTGFTGMTFMYKKEIEFEPSIVAIGPTYFAAGMNSRMNFYRGGWPKPVMKWNAPKPKLSLKPGENVFQKDYLGTVKLASLNTSMAAVLLVDGRLQVHSIDERAIVLPPSFNKVFPLPDTESQDLVITAVSLTNDLLIYGTASGHIHHFSLEDWALVSEVKHQTSIQEICPQPKRARFIFRDENGEAYLCDPVADVLFSIPNISTKTVGFIWETSASSERSIFVSWDDMFITTHAYIPYSIKEQQCLALGTTKLSHGLKPLLFVDGVVVCQTPGGKLSHVRLSTHEPINIQGIDDKNEKAVGKMLQMLYTLGRMNDLWALITRVSSRKAWTMLAEAALHILDLQTAKRVYCQILHDPGMVITLSDILDATCEERNVLAGHVSVIFGDFDRAQELFLASSEPIQALVMRRDLMHWDHALSLASKLAPSEVSLIAKEFAARLESESKFTEALTMYEKALETSTRLRVTESVREDHQVSCSAGVTRMTFRMGDTSRGMKMLSGVDDCKLLNDCAAILEGIKMYMESGGLYERAKQWEKAAEVYTKGKLWNKVGPLLEHVSTPKIFLQYAKAKEAAKQYEEAAAAYEKGKDHENLVRLYVEHLQNIDGAVKIVRETRSRDSARIVSKFFQSMRDYKSVVEFLLMAGMVDEAFELAQHHDVMEHFGEIVQAEATTEMLFNIATYFESRDQLLNAGIYLLKAKNYIRALKMFIRCPVLDGKPVELAIETVGLAKSDGLTHELIDYLMGENDGIPKEAKYIFKLYMSLGAYRDAARTAIIIAREEQMLGNYRAAHDLLLDNFRQLRKCKAKVPADLERMLMLLHSYILVKTLIRLNQHELGARMLIRVSNSISKFPTHIVPILTSTVIECHRADLKKEAYDYAAMLMRPEYRNLVDAKYKRKIEQIVRRPDKEENTIAEKLTPCPYCKYMVPETSLDCIECKNHLPYCISSGKHMTLEDWAVCPTCEFPSLLKEFKMVVAQTNACPMCNVELKVEELKLAPNAEELLRGVKERVDNTVPKEKTEGVKEYTTGTGAGKPVGLVEDVPFGAMTGEKQAAAAAAPSASRV